MALSIAFTRLYGLNRSLLLFLEKICMACLLFLNMPMRLKCAPILFLNAVYRTADGIYALKRVLLGAFPASLHIFSSPQSAAQTGDTTLRGGDGSPRGMNALLNSLP